MHEPSRLARRSEPLVITVSYPTDRVQLTIEGEACGREATEEIDAVLHRVHEQAMARAVGVVAVDLTRLDFMSSSCFKCFIVWLRRAQQLETGQYQIRFRAADSADWLHASLRALKVFAVQLVTVETMATAVSMQPSKSATPQLRQALDGVVQALLTRRASDVLLSRISTLLDKVENGESKEIERIHSLVKTFVDDQIADTLLADLRAVLEAA